ncbi:MAG: LysR family transcriptional regulator [Terriglobia bacterium]
MGIMTAMHIGALHLNQLRLVDALARNGNLGEAAEQIGLTQSAASHALARLREELQDPIFIRTSEGMRPTPYGIRLAASVHDALLSLRAGLDRHPEFVPGTSSRTFNVIMSDVSQMLYLPRLLARLSAEAPGVTLRVRAVPAKAPHLILETGEVDLAVGTFTKLIAGCRQKRLYRERYVCVVRRDHPQFEQGMTVEAFCSVPQAAVDPRGYVHEQLDRLLAQQKMPRTAKLYVPYFLSLPLVIERSDLLVIMANRVAQMYAKMVPLKIMPPPAKLPAYDTKLFWHERFHRDPANRWLRGLYIDLFGD